MHIYDVSLTISPALPVWPGDPPVVVERFSRMEEGASSNVSKINMGVHVGTHVDAPYHFLGGQSLTVENLPLNLLTGRAYVLRLPDEVDCISAAVLEKAKIPPRTRRLLFKTRNSAIWQTGQLPFQTRFVALSADGAQYLIKRGVKLVGVDYLSVAPFDLPDPTHRILLAAGMVIIEGLDLSQVEPGRYTLYCLPLKIAGGDGAPARTILVGV